MTDMSIMFCSSKFNFDLSHWDMSNVQDISGMFSYSCFNRDISDWDLSNVREHYRIFYDSPIQDNYKPLKLRYY